MTKWVLPTYGYSRPEFSGFPVATNTIRLFNHTQNKSRTLHLGIDCGRLPTTENLSEELHRLYIVTWEHEFARGTTEQATSRISRINLPLAVVLDGLARSLATPKPRRPALIDPAPRNFLQQQQKRSIPRP
jgi:hypothetical protein